MTTPLSPSSPTHSPPPTLASAPLSLPPDLVETGVRPPVHFNIVYSTPGSSMSPGTQRQEVQTHLPLRKTLPPGPSPPLKFLLLPTLKHERYPRKCSVHVVCTSTPMTSRRRIPPLGPTSKFRPLVTSSRPDRLQWIYLLSFTTPVGVPEGLRSSSLSRRRLSLLIRDRFDLPLDPSHNSTFGSLFIKCLLRHQSV